ncbi:MAG TPA: hypothetical protein VK737_03570, partial [Opitutales bacterium]|nr:hypothetical protein [Opitutales bacterium]
PTGVVTTSPSGLNGRPTSLVVDAQDNLYAVCNNLNGDFIYKVTPAGVVSVVVKMSGLMQMALMPTPSTRASNAATVPPPAAQINSMVIFLASPAIILVVVLVLWLVLRKKREAQ